MEDRERPATTGRTQNKRRRRSVERLEEEPTPVLFKQVITGAGQHMGEGNDCIEALIGFIHTCASFYVNEEGERDTRNYRATLSHPDNFQFIRHVAGIPLRFRGVLDPMTHALLAAICSPSIEETQRKRLATALVCHWVLWNGLEEVSLPKFPACKPPKPVESWLKPATAYYIREALLNNWEIVQEDSQARQEGRLVDTRPPENRIYSPSPFLALMEILKLNPSSRPKKKALDERIADLMGMDPESMSRLTWKEPPLRGSGHPFTFFAAELWTIANPSHPDYVMGEDRSRWGSEPLPWVLAGAEVDPEKQKLQRILENILSLTMQGRKARIPS
jgi:hypothetical protein